MFTGDEPLRFLVEINITFELIEVGIERVEARKYAKEFMDMICAKHHLRRYRISHPHGKGGRREAAEQLRKSRKGE